MENESEMRAADSNKPSLTSLTLHSRAAIISKIMNDPTTVQRLEFLVFSYRHSPLPATLELRARSIPCTQTQKIGQIER